MKFRTYLENIDGIDVYPIVSLLLFVVFFTAVTIWAFRTPQATITYLENLPLGNNQ